MSRAWQWVKRVVRTAYRLARHDQLPRWLRWMFIIMFAPIPGPFDEMIGLIAVGLAFVFYRQVLKDTWLTSE